MSEDGKDADGDAEVEGTEGALSVRELLASGQIGRHEAPTRTLYDKLVEAYREVPSNHRLAARVAGTYREAARRAYFVGWPKYGLEPICKVLEREQAKLRADRFVTLARAEREKARDEAREAIASARAAVDAAKREASATREAAQAEAIAKLEEAERLASAALEDAEVKARAKISELLDRAKVDAAETKADEALASRFARKNAMSALAVANQALAKARVVAERELTEDEIKAMSPKERVAFLVAHAKLVHETNEAAKIALAIERIRVGEPTEILGLQITTMTPTEAVSEIENAAALASIARARGLIDRSEDSPKAQASEASAN